MISCYNRGCGKDFDPANNPDGKFLFVPNTFWKYEMIKRSSKTNVHTHTNAFDLQFLPLCRQLNFMNLLKIRLCSTIFIYIILQILIKCSSNFDSILEQNTFLHFNLIVFFALFLFILICGFCACVQRCLSSPSWCAVLP